MLIVISFCYKNIDYCFLYLGGNHPITTSENLYTTNHCSFALQILFFTDILQFLSFALAPEALKAFVTVLMLYQRDQQLPWTLLGHYPYRVYLITVVIQPCYFWGPGATDEDRGRVVFGRFLVISIFSCLKISSGFRRYVGDMKHCNCINSMVNLSMFLFFLSK